MLVHPQFDPVALQLGPLAVRWYGLMYLAAFLQVWLLGRYRARNRITPGWLPKDVEDLMFYGVIKALVSGVIVALASETARRNAALGALVASLPLVSVLSTIWLWRDTHDMPRVADHVQATLWYVLPSLLMFFWSSRSC